MASTLNLQATINWCGAFIKYQPLTIGGMEPALTTANMILQTMLGPPFCWRWNRNQVNFTCIPSPVTTDYVQAVPTFNFIEKAWMSDGTDIKEIEVQNALAQTKEIARPAYIAAQSDDGLGNVTFRLMSAPDKAYTATVLVQNKPVLMSSLASLWTPIPDENAIIFNYGFLALTSILRDDPRFPIFNQKFVSHLLGAQEGLDEMKRNIFLGSWLEVTKALLRAQGKTTQGISAQQQ